MRVAIIKQAPDMFGPLESVKWGDIGKLILVWPGKASYFELTLLLEADWYVIDKVIHTDYTKDLFFCCKGVSEIIAQNVRTVPLDTIPLDSYDIVICMDPLIGVPRKGLTVYAYFVHEHWDKNYSDSMKKPLYDFDLFLAHNSVSKSTLTGLPDSVVMPYPRCPDKLRKLYGKKKETIIYVDWRSITSIYEGHLWNEKADEIFQSIYFPLPVLIHKDMAKSFYSVCNPLRKGEIDLYYRNIGKSKYFVSIGRKSGSGQSICDAASLGCICIGSERPCHKTICHPMCQSSDMYKVGELIEQIESSSYLQDRILQYQDDKLNDFFYQYPLSLFRKSIEYKLNPKIRG